MTHLSFIKAFEDHSLPKPEWTHAAHIRMAWIYLMQYPVTVALEKARNNIKSFNAAKGGAPELYHETITAFYIHALAERLSTNFSLTWNTFAKENLDLLTWKPPLIEKFYSKDLLYSTSARQTFVQPDLRAHNFKVSEGVGSPTIRKARSADSAAIGDLLVSAFTDAFRRKTPHLHITPERERELRDIESRLTNTTTLVAEKKAEIVGTVTVLPVAHKKSRAWQPHYAELRFLAVGPNQRCQGLSQKLLRAAIGQALVAEAEGVCLHVRREAVGVATLYQEFGFVRDQSADVNTAGVSLEAYSLKLA